MGPIHRVSKQTHDLLCSNTIIITKIKLLENDKFIHNSIIYARHRKKQNSEENVPLVTAVEIFVSRKVQFFAWHARHNSVPRVAGC